MILCVLRTPRTIIGLYRDTFPLCRLYTYFSSILNLPHLKGFHRTAVVLQSPWKQCSEWTGWTNPIPNSREGGLGNTPNNPMDSLPDNFELAYYKEPVKISLDNMNLALQLEGNAEL